MQDGNTKQIVKMANNRLVVESAEKDNYTIFRVIGCLTQKEKDGVALLNKAVIECHGEAALLDMTDSFVIDAFAIGNLLLLNGAVIAQHKTLAILINGDSNVLKRLQGIQIPQIIPIYTSLAACAVALAQI